MNFLEFPKEIRLLVYSELLVCSGPILFEEIYYSSPLLRYQHGPHNRLWLSLLRVNKQIHGEARSVLYANNSFWFPVTVSIGSEPPISHCAQFLHQIGTSAATLIRHIGITLPDFEPFEQNPIRLYEPQEQDLELIRDICTSITTLELSLPAFHRLRITHFEVEELIFDAADIVVQSVALLDTHFKTIRSLKDVIVDFEVQYEENEEDKVYDDKLRKQMEKYGWAIKITKLPKPTFSSREHEWIEFDDEEERDAYDEEQHYRREEERERQEWIEEYEYRRTDPYWRNDSDFD